MLAYEAIMETANDKPSCSAKGVYRHGLKFRIRWFDHKGDRQSEVFATAKKAEAALRKHLSEVDDIRAGLKKAFPDRTFDELFNYWVAKRVQHKRSGSDDESIIRKHLRPSFGALRLRDFSVEHVDDFREERDDLSEKTVHNHLTLLRTLLGVARDELGWIGGFAKFKKPRLRLFESDFRYLRNDDEIRRFLAAARDEGPLAFTLYATAIYTGMRAGELGGLRRGDIDFEAGRITVQRSFDGPTKSGDARYIPLLAPLVPVLKQWLLQSPADHVFLNNEGGVLRPSGRIYQEVLQRVLEAGGFDTVTTSAGKQRHYIRFHDLRHTFASTWVSKGGDLFKLQKILGHKSPVMTQRYAHLSPDAFKGDIERLGSVDALAEGVVLKLRA